MSTLKVNDITEATSGGGKIFPARAWIAINGQGTISIRGDGNVSSISDNGTGDFTSTFSNTLSNASFGIAGMITTWGPSDPGGHDVHLYSSSSGAGPSPVLSTSSVRVEIGRGGSENQDFGYVSWTLTV